MVFYRLPGPLCVTGLIEQTKRPGNTVTREQIKKSFADMLGLERQRQLLSASGPDDNKEISDLMEQAVTITGERENPAPDRPGRVDTTFGQPQIVSRSPKRQGPRRARVTRRSEDGLRPVRSRFPLPQLAPSNRAAGPRSSALVPLLTSRPQVQRVPFANSARTLIECARALTTLEGTRVGRYLPRATSACFRPG
jgi:hypothetical protein